MADKFGVIPRKPHATYYLPLHSGISYRRDQSLNLCSTVMARTIGLTLFLGGLVPGTMNCLYSRRNRRVYVPGIFQLIRSPPAISDREE
ncbi:uncharacterized protein BO87DRAFT_228938 [Aspergillus neoniger CBS 115656]|uniref:Uncharacterized protein n=1 Tax=Aspergillus neoniger (strain CBS 115656) TaxID=1448310 RepID=A0A318YQU0_ASPNB|nr:hypothetical protein BO87DRAFT_228938 [Aspergillus neoniger CBS 115656]PYH36694.1 hypothetical protein BO87DRAFT_228938 [Aspergillus neoniger CBS 115656]